MLNSGSQVIPAGATQFKGPFPLFSLQPRLLHPPAYLQTVSRSHGQPYTLAPLRGGRTCKDLMFTDSGPHTHWNAFTRRANRQTKRITVSSLHDCQLECRPGHHLVPECCPMSCLTSVAHRFAAWNVFMTTSLAVAYSSLLKDPLAL